MERARAERRRVVISIVMPAHNEADFLDASVRAVVAGLHASAPAGEVVVVENGSTDATVAVAERLAAQLPGVRVISLPRPDYGAALRAGFLAARGDIVVNFDVDYYDLEFLDTAVALIRGDGGPDVVVGSKRAAGSRDERSWPRRLITAAFALVLRRGFGLAVSDTHGIKAMRREPLLPLVARCRVAPDLFDTELVLRAERAGLDVTEVPVAVTESRPSRTSIVRRGLRSVGGLARLRLALWQERA